MQPLYEQYRPRKWSEVVGQDKVVAIIERLRPRGLGGRAYWISGKSGQGKTTIGRLIAREVAQSDACIHEPRAFGAAELEALQTACFQRPLLGRGVAFIVNEAHGLPRHVVRQLLVLLEALPSHVCVIFTSTRDGLTLFEDSEDAHPLLSRCVRLNLTTQTGPAYAERLKQIAAAEGLDGRPVEAYLRLYRDSGCNMRACLQAIEAGAML